MSASKTNSYPLDPTQELNPLRHLKKGDWHEWPINMLNEEDFNKKWEIVQLLCNNIYWVKEKGIDNYYLLKKYKTYGNPDNFNRIYKEFIFVRQTYLIEYIWFYYIRDHENREVYILMPYYSESLKQMIIKNGPINRENDIKLIAAHLLDKMWIIHNSGYVHCDIKAANVVKREFPEEINNYIMDGYKIIDFGCIHKNNSKGIYVGTIGWSAPEINPNSSKNRYKYSCDIFSFGLLILYILCGQHPLQIPERQYTKYYDGIKKENKNQFTHFEIVKKIHSIWYNNIILKSENMIKNYLVKLYYDNKISVELFELLHDGMLIFDVKKRWNCKQIYNSKWFNQDISSNHVIKSHNNS